MKDSAKKLLTCILCVQAPLHELLYSYIFKVKIISLTNLVMYFIFILRIIIRHKSISGIKITLFCYKSKKKVAQHNIPYVIEVNVPT